ncbi:hydroxyacid dehydrogenase [Streptomyces sp. NPDC048629]|uniref:Hydroxyacid dehydrogenase n=2 Tax=Streptomyces solicathayae TaxID=3081768 RepID=A0ABZ0M438_9ACTN|nr:hydroxyacid dehydrogenase [Streptomyces sp. HUAS YS2]WOX26502.1 hydroxyacid dehydrogenase [Streptomyces sp. HUAS YS2]
MDISDEPPERMRADSDATAGATTLRRPRTALAMDPSHVESVFPPDVRARLLTTAELLCPGPVTDFSSAAARSVLAEVDVLVTGWGCPEIGTEALDAAPNLRAVIHAAGTVKTFLSPEVHSRGIVVSSAAAANAVPVAEFAFAAIVFGAKRAFSLAGSFRSRRTHRTPADLAAHPWLGTHRLTVGIIGASYTGRRLLGMLGMLDATVLLYDPYVSRAEAEREGWTLVDLDILAATSDVVSIHAPHTPDTHHLLDRRLLDLMRPGTVVVNTARGALVDTDALTEQLVAGRLDAVLDVTSPEPLPPDHPLWTLPNVFLTPHLAGALGNEVGRLGALAVDELARYARGEPFLYPVRHEDLARRA